MVTWDGARFGPIIDNLGTIGDNWVGGQVPSAGDDIIIPATSGDLRWSDVSLGSVTIEAGWEQTWVADGVTINGDSALRDATIVLSVGNFTVASGATVTGQSVKLKPGLDSFDPKVMVEATSTLSIPADQFISFEIGLENLGNVKVANNGTIALGEGGNFWNRQSLTFAANGVVSDWVSGRGTLTNTGFIQQTGEGNVEFRIYVMNSWLIATGTGTSHMSFASTVEMESIWNTGILRIANGTTMEFGNNGLYSLGGEIQTVNGFTNVARTTGKMHLVDTVINLGYNSTSGKCTLLGEEIILAGGCTLNVTLNWTNDSADMLQGTNVSFYGSNTVNIRQVDRPAILPAPPHTFTVVQGTTALTGDFTGWGIADLTHGKTGNRIWLGVPPQNVPPPLSPLPMSPPPMSPPPMSPPPMSPPPPVSP